MRVRPEIYEALRESATCNNRSIAAEAEVRVVASFDRYPLTEDRVRAIVLQELIRADIKAAEKKFGIGRLECGERDWLQLSS